MLVTIFSMCALLLGSGEYDCDEKWAVFIYDERDVFKYCYPGEKSFHFSVIGCAIHGDTRGHTIILGNNGVGKSHTGHQVFLHEVMHLSCLCNFHASPPEEPRR